MSKNIESTVSYTAGNESDVAEEATIIKIDSIKTEAEPVNKAAPVENQRVKNIKTWVSIALLVIPLIIILLNMALRKDDQETSRKVDAVSNALYKIMQVIANNPNALAINGVAATEGEEDVLSNFQFPQFSARNLSAT
jgi:hypothetical protein